MESIQVLEDATSTGGDASATICPEGLIQTNNVFGKCSYFDDGGGSGH